MGTSGIVFLVRRVRDVVAEMNYASKRMIELRLFSAAGESDRAPDTYAEFLLRAPGTSIHEPPARRRAALPESLRPGAGLA
ncbi:MAG: hypothetical protein JO037_24310 [Actinobacteria bacterium]|nr:hypothetical protein [Actinomycetota bacterium]